MAKIYDARQVGNKFVTVEIDSETGETTAIGNARSQSETLQSAVELQKAETAVTQARIETLRAEIKALGS